MKTGRILDEEDGSFGFEYDTGVGTKNTMRLDALTYETAIREGRLYLGINQDNQDEDGAVWEVE